MYQYDIHITANKILLDNIMYLWHYALLEIYNKKRMYSRYLYVIGIEFIDENSAIEKFSRYYSVYVNGKYTYYNIV